MMEPSGAGPSRAPAAPAWKSVDLPVTSVLLLEDRAQVERRGELDLQAGSQVLVLEGLSPLVVDGSLRCELSGDCSGAVVVRLAVARRLAPSAASRPEDLARMEDLLRERRRALRAMQDRLAHLQHRQKLLDGMYRGYLRDIATDVAWGRAEPRAWREQLRAMGQGRDELRDELLHLRGAAGLLEDDIRDLRRQRDEMEQPSAVVAASLQLELLLPDAGRVELRLTYLVASACWRPWHRARLAERPSGGRELVFNMGACIWQRCGEDWRDARLRLSTQRASAGSGPPPLREDILVSEPRQEAVVIQAREQEISSIGLEEPLVETSHELPGIDDAGVALAVDVPGLHRIPSDGRPYRVELEEFRAGAELELLVMAERVPAAVRRCLSRNESQRPILAGPVELMMGHGRVGRTSVRRTEPGERLEIGFGPDPAVRVKRRQEQLDLPGRAMSRWDRTRHRVEIFLSNLGSHARRVSVVERVPVSEVEQARVSLDSDTTPAASPPDRDGMLRWTRTLEPGSTDRLLLCYTVAIDRDALLT